MTVSRSVVRAALIAALAVPAVRGSGARAASADDPAGRDLVDAYTHSDFARLARIGRLESARGLADRLADGRAAYALAAIAATLAAEDAWQLLGDLAGLAANPDRQIGPAAARVAAQIAQSLDPERVSQLEITPAELRARARAWARVARHQGAWPDVRVHAVEINYLLARILAPRHRGGVELDLGAVSGDPEPEVRRAALELYPQPLDSAARTRAIEVLHNDADPVVALVAGQVICGGVAMGDASAPIVGAVTEAGLERLRNLIGNATLPIAARLDAGYCLQASGNALDIAALKRLVATSPRFAVKQARDILRGARK